MLFRSRNIEVRDHYDEEGRLVIDDELLERIYEVLTDAALRREIVDHNFEVGRREFGLARLEARLRNLLEDYGDEIRASRRRLAKASTRYSV